MRRLDVIARVLVAVCILLLFGHIHMMSVYYPGSPRSPDVVHVVPVDYKGGLIYVQAWQQILINRLLAAALCAGLAAISLWTFEWVVTRRRDR